MSLFVSVNMDLRIYYQMIVQLCVRERESNTNNVHSLFLTLTVRENENVRGRARECALSVPCARIVMMVSGAAGTRYSRQNRIYDGRAAIICDRYSKAPGNHSKSSRITGKKE